MILSAQNVSFKAGGCQILNDISISVGKGEFLGIIGPNGSGKTSLMSLLSGLKQSQTGQVTLEGVALRKMPRRHIAQRLAFVEQQAQTNERITARQAVELGRTPHLGALTPWSSHDDQIVKQALVEVDMLHLADRMWDTLSGGERQRLHIGRALAQQSPILLLDEPTNHLDIGHQLGLLDLVRQQKLTTIAALHDLNHAAMFCDRVAVMQNGSLIACGTPHEVLEQKIISDVFGVHVEVETLEDGSCHLRYCTPKRPLNKRQSVKQSQLVEAVL